METRQFELGKPVWTEADFEQMGWHDVHVHALAFRPELFELWLDIDYIFGWIEPHGGETHYSFWVAPATLVFKNVCDLKFHIESHNGDLSLQGIKRSAASAPGNATTRLTEWVWLLDFNEGQMTLRSAGFSQFTRRPPVLGHAQQLTVGQRGGVSFERSYTAQQTRSPKIA